ncbi:hypothetical protein PFISCL1PPCAC_28443, partial [Pristionchus fissidentatus]
MVKTPKAPKPAKAAPIRRYTVTEEDRDELIDLERMLVDERTISPNERVNIIVEYAYLGQKPRPETYIGRPRYIKASRHGRTRLAKRTRRVDVEPPKEKMIVYDDTVAQFLHKARYADLRHPGDAASVKDECMMEEEGKDHSRDSGCPVSPSDKKEDDKKVDGPCSSRGSVEKENRKLRSPGSAPQQDEATSTTGTSHFKVMGNTPLSVIRRKLEQKRIVNEDLKLELIDASGTQYLDESWTVAQLANERGWARRGPLRVLYTVTRFSCNEDLPVLVPEANFVEPEEAAPLAAAAVAPPPLQQLQHQRPMQHGPPFPHPFGFPHPHAPFAFFDEKSQQMMMMHPQLPYPIPMGPEEQSLLKLSPAHAPPSHHPLHHQMMGGGGAGAPPTFVGGPTVPSKQQQRHLQQLQQL